MSVESSLVEDYKFENEKNQLSLSVCLLPVDEAHDSSLQSHPDSEAVKHVLMMEERLQTGQQEEQRGKQETFPHLSIFVPHEGQQQADNNNKSNQ